MARPTPSSFLLDATVSVATYMPYRQPTPFERQLLERLLDLSEAGHDLRSQAASCRVRTITEYGDNYGSIDIQVQGERDPAGLRALVEAHANDVDGIPIAAILFVSKGRLCELEIVRLDGDPIVRMPSPSEFDLMV